MTLAEALPIVSALSPSEKLQLIEVLAVQVRGSTPPAVILDVPRKTDEGAGSARLFGILAGLGPVPSAEEIDQAREEMWGRFASEEP
jgi:hypothetical protein